MPEFYLDEEVVWKCRKHPSKRYRPGICPKCLRERLSLLCPDCGNVRPCACSAVTTSSSSSSSSSFSRFSVSGGENFVAGIGTFGRVSNLIESEPAFRRSRSAAVPFLRSKTKSKFLEKVDFDGYEVSSENRNKTTSPFWGWLKKGNNNDDNNDKSKSGCEVEEERRTMMRKSRSVAVTTSDYGKSNSKVSKWYFPSPIKAFRQSRLSKVVLQERSPIFRR